MSWSHIFYPPPPFISSVRGPCVTKPKIVAVLVHGMHRRTCSLSRAKCTMNEAARSLNEGERSLNEVECS
jgi:hypothetical protein